MLNAMNPSLPVKDAPVQVERATDIQPLLPLLSI